MVPTSGDALRVTLVESPEALEAFGDAYDDLADRVSGLLFPAFRRDWIAAARPVFLAPGTTIFFLLAWRGARLVGAAPLQRECRSLGLTEVAWLGFIGQHHGQLVLDNLSGDFLIPDESDSESCMRAFRDALAGPLRGRWDRLDLEHFGEFSPGKALVRTLFPVSSERPEEGMPGFIADLPEPPVPLDDSLDKNTARGLRRSMRLLAESELAFAFETHTNASETLIAEMDRVHTERQRELEQKGRTDRHAVFADRQGSAAVHALLRASAAADRLRIHALRIERRLAAFCVVLPSGPQGICWIAAFDPAFQQFSPSRLVFQYLYRVEAERYGTRTLDLMLGYTRTKEELTTRRYLASRIMVDNIWSLRSRLRRRAYDGAKQLLAALRSR